MNSEIRNVLIVLIHQSSCALDHKLRLVLAIVLDVPCDVTEGCVLEVACQELKKNRFASTRGSHKKSCPALWGCSIQVKEDDCEEKAGCLVMTAEATVSCVACCVMLAPDVAPDDERYWKLAKH